MAAPKPDTLTEREQQLLRDYAEGMRIRDTLVEGVDYERLDANRVRLLKTIRCRNETVAAVVGIGEPVDGSEVWRDAETGKTLGELRRLDARAARRIKRAYERGEEN